MQPKAEQKTIGTGKQSEEDAAISRKASGKSIGGVQPAESTSRNSQKYRVWTEAENYAYITYLSNYRHFFQTEAQRKKHQVFVHLACFLKSKNHKQIKSHHQKMFMKFGSLEAIVEGIADAVFQISHSIPELKAQVEIINARFTDFWFQEGPLPKTKPRQRTKKGPSDAKAYSGGPTAFQPKIECYSELLEEGSQSLEKLESQGLSLVPITVKSQPVD